MDAILIIEDQLKMVEILQEYLSTLNTNISQENVFCYSDRMDIEPLINISRKNKRINFKGHEDKVIEEMLRFLKTHRDGQVFVMLDFLLISLDASLPSYEQYKNAGEYSDRIYLELLKAMFRGNIEKNKEKLESIIKDKKSMKMDVGAELKRLEGINKDLKRYEGINQDFDFTLYSRSDASCSLMSLLLEEQYKKGAFDGLDSSLYTYTELSWIKNRCMDIDRDGQPLKADPALDLPEEYVEYIENELFKGGVGSGKTS